MKKENTVKKWLFWFGLAVAIIAVYNILGNFTKVTQWVGELFRTLMPFVIGILIAYNAAANIAKIVAVYFLCFIFISIILYAKDVLFQAIHCLPNIFSPLHSLPYSPSALIA